MKKVDFDKHAEEYEKVLSEDLSKFGEESGYFAEYKIKLTRKYLKTEPISILDFGCGIGRNIKYFREYFPDSKIFGCDISEKSLEIARKNNPDTEFFKISDDKVNEYNDKFDLVFTSCVFHHIQPSLRYDSMNKIKDMLKKGNCFVIYEHNPFNPITRKIVRDCMWDADAILLKPKEVLTLTKDSGLIVRQRKYTLFFPSFLKIFRFLEKYIGFLPAGGQYYVIAEKP